jgi:acyl-CoA thioesterase-1
MTLAAPTRRAALVLGAASLATPAFAQSPPVVTMLGDSITAGYGLPAAAALPAQLQAALIRLGRPVRVRGAGVSGDTTANGLARVDFSVQSDTRLCIVALGGNDLLRGLEPSETRANLTRIVQKLQRRHIQVMIAGLKAPTVIGAGYARDFDRVFPEVARATGADLYPDLLAGVQGVAALNQGDGIHPNPRGVRIIVARLAPAVARVLARRG